MSLIGEIAGVLEDYYKADAGDSNDAVNDAADEMAELLVKIGVFIEEDYPLPTRP